MNVGEYYLHILIFGDYMSASILYQNKNVFFSSFIAIFILLLSALLLFHFNKIPQFITLTIPSLHSVFISLLFFLLFFSGIAYGFVTKDKFKASIFGLLFSVLFSFYFVVLDPYRQYPTLDTQLFSGLSFVLMGVSISIASFFTSVDNIHLRQRLPYYLLALLFLGISVGFYLLGLSRRVWLL